MEEKKNIPTVEGEAITPEAPAADIPGTDAPSPDLTAGAPPQEQAGVTVSEPGDVVVSFDKIEELMAERRAALLKAHSLPEKTPVPADMLFASGSGLEPFISPEAAEFQLNRVASTRGVPPEKIRKLVSEHFVRGGILGENVVNVMTLNAALDTLFPMSGM